MSSLTNINNNSSVVNVGRTTPVSPGQQPADKSIPVVLASDQKPIPVVEQNKVLSEVALSLLGIPRSEVALGIFADVNTYDVNPSEWSAVPAEYTLDANADGWGIKHLPDEAGALVEAPKDKTAVLTSKRFFRYQPGRVSAATFGVKSTVSPSSNTTLNKIDLNPAIRKYGIFDKFDGYYWETRADGKGDNFSVVRRTQSLLRSNPVSFGTQLEDHGVSGKAPNVYSEEPNAYPTATKFLTDNRFAIIETAFAAALPGGSTSTQVGGADRTASVELDGLTEANKAKCKRDMDLATEAYILDLQYGGNAHSIVNATTYRIAAVSAPTVENLVHRKLREAIADALDGIGETAASNKVYNTGANTELAYWTLLALSAPTTRPNSSEINAANYGSRSGIATVFAIYSKFLGYVASEYTINADGTAVEPVTYQSSTISLSKDEIKYRCFRDVTYILKGYAEDLEFGGDASTIYNAKRYYFNGIQIYSQTPGGAAGEIRRHTFIKKLLTDTNALTIPTPAPGGNKSLTPLKSLFPNVFGTNEVTKLNYLTDLIIENFSVEYVGTIEYGRGANYGDLVVLRDGLIMTHAAAFDPTLLKATKNVVAKPSIFARTTATGSVVTPPTAQTITVASATGLTKGMTVSGTNIPPGTYVTNISGTTVTISQYVTGSVSGTVAFGTSTLEASQDEFIVGQYINFYGTAAGASSHGLIANRLYRVEKVRGTRGNIITLSDATVKNKFTANIAVSGNPVSSATLSFAVNGNLDNVTLGLGTRIEGKGIPEGTYVDAIIGSTYSLASPNGLPSNNLTGIEVTKIAVISPDVNPSSPTLIYINPNVPFVFPKEYFVGKVPSNLTTYKKQDGMFPLMYAATLPAPTADNEKVGYIDTSIVSESPALLKQQIDLVNLTYNNWVKQNVDPRYYSVYEYRVPRSRFSTDRLNGATNNAVYSDVAINPAGQRIFPGTPVVDVENSPVQNVSVWNIDFTKVTMLKVEFSWYGAVGALFLAYVPVGNGEARWVRVHHLRASNQLKISSLGNATLPITYLVYGGGSVDRLGIEDTTPKGYTKSDHIVKYGASYYIDGGDRGTVRLYSHSSLDPVNVYGGKYTLGNLVLQAADSTGLRHFDVSSVQNLPSDKKFFMKAKLLTASKADQNVEIVWVDGNKLYINKGDLISKNSLSLIANRSSIVFGLKAKQNILNSIGTGIRNRVQVYPTKLSTLSVAPSGVTTSPKIKLQMLKTPLFQPEVTTDEVNGFILENAYTITPSNIELDQVTASNNYLSKDGESIYGWFRANVGTVFGMLYRQNSKYYFNLLETYSEDVILLPGLKFLADGRFDFNGDAVTGVAEDTIQKERLSSVFVSTQTQTPIPRSGIEIASFYLKDGADLFDLLTYFDYNKDYLSFPLTDKVESIYLVASSTQASTGATAVAEISSSLTWEEQ